nr:hypothetical protein [Tanacetum cinerariifolium]
MNLPLTENVTVAGADNRPHMLNKTQYSSLASRMLLYIKGKENVKLVVDSVLNGPFKYGTVTEPRTLTTPTIVKDRNLTWFKEKAMLTEALQLGVVLNEEQMSFLADNGDTVVTSQASQKIPTIAAFQTNDLDEFDSKSDKAPSASAVLIAKLYSYDSEVLSKEKEDKYLEEIIELENKKKALDNVVYKMGLFKELTVMKEVFNQMKTKVAKCFVDRKYFEIEKKELIIENDHLLEHIICQDVMSGVMHADVESNNVLPANNNMLAYDNLKAELLKKGNDGLLELIISQDLVHTAVNTLATIANHQNM